MAGVGQQIFPCAGITDDQQRRAEHGQLTGLLDNVAHFRPNGEDLAKGAGVLNGHRLQLAPHTDRRTQHRYRAGQYLLAVFAFEINRSDLQQEVLPVNHHVLGVGLLRTVFQPALDVKIGNQLRDRVAAQLLLTLAKQLAAGRVSQFDFSFGIQRQHRFRHRHQQRAERQVLPL